MATKYDASSIKIITDDRDRVRKRPTIYIPSTDSVGAEHIIFEIVDNAIDELTVKNSVGKNVTLIYDITTKVCTVIDDGRGIPQERLKEVCTILNSSGKFDNDENSAYEYSGGLNGVGLKLGVFLSEWATATSMQHGKSLTWNFDDGAVKDSSTTKSKEHGTIIKFKLSQKFVDINDLKTEVLETRLHEKSYMHPELKMQLIILNKDKEVSTKTYNGSSIEDRVREWKPDTEIIRVTDSRKVAILKNITDENIEYEKVIVDLAFAYKEDAIEEEPDKFIISYGNTIKTYTGGAHIDGLKEGLVKYFKKKIIPEFGKRDRDLPISPSDITIGLCGFVIAKVHKPEFRGQYKDALTNQEVKFAVRDAVYDAMDSVKPSTIKDMAEFVKRVTRGRLASKKSRKKDVSNIFSKDRIDKFVDVVRNTQTTHPELILMEGDSAVDQAAKNRDPYNQAIFGIKNPANIFDMETSSIANAAKTMFNDIMDICGLEPGKKCIPDRSVMDMILLLTDGDVDGDNIAISTVCLLAKHCKPLIDAGMVGRILPPAYRIEMKDGTKFYVHSQRDFYEKMMGKFSKATTIKLHGRKLGRTELIELISSNIDYDVKLDKLADRYCCEAEFMELIARKYHGHEMDQKKSYWMNVMKPYDGLSILIEDGIMIIDGDIPKVGYINIPFDKNFDKHLHRFKIYQEINDHIDGFEIDGQTNKTLYNIMKTFRKFNSAKISRFKGLGELSDDEMRTLCMDTTTRTVIIFKFEDFEDDMEKINVIMSSKAKYAEIRSNLMMGLRASDTDIDT